MSELRLNAKHCFTYLICVVSVGVHNYLTLDALIYYKKAQPAAEMYSGQFLVGFVFFKQVDVTSVAVLALANLTDVNSKLTTTAQADWAD